MNWLTAVACLLLLLSWQIGFPLWVMSSAAPEDDLLRIKTEYQGLQGRAGPGVQVLSIQKIGSRWGYPYGTPARKYSVDLRFRDGEVRRKVVSIDASFFGDGLLSEDS